MSVDVAVIGAGMSGLVAAASLRAGGRSVLVIDKGRAVGGRMATRRIDGAHFDHGAQHYSARDERFAALNHRWVADGIAATWYEGRSITQPDRGVEPRWVGVGGMRRIPEYLAADLDVRLATRVVRLTPGEGMWSIASEGNPAVSAASIVLTAPMPQTLELLDASGIGDRVDDLRSLAYAATLAVMATLDGPSGLPDGHRAFDEGPMAWLADNHHKGTSPRPCVTIHSSPAYAADHLDDDPAGWTEHLVSVARPHLSADVVAATGHRWRYAQPEAPLAEGCRMLADDPQLLLAGEIFAGAKVEGAVLSGLAAADTILA